MYKARMFKAETLKAGTLKAGLFILLLTQSMILQALPVETTTDKAVKDSTLESAAEAATETTTEAARKPTRGEQQATDSQLGNFPHWPERQQSEEELTPPPPPGPYMSTAMNDHSLQGRSFARRMNKPVRRTESSAMSMDMFSPDRPWPGDLRPAKRRMPEKAHQFVSPPTHNTGSYPATMHNKPPRTNYGYRSGPGMTPSGNWPTMNTSGPGRVPSMGMAPGNPYSGNAYPVSRNNFQPRAYQPGEYQHTENQHGADHSGVHQGAHRSGGQSTGQHSGDHCHRKPVNPAPYPQQGRP